MTDFADFASFYKAHYRLILTIAENRLSSLHDAEEVTSETFRVALQRHQAGDPLTLPWLHGVVRNLVGNEYRRRTRAAALHERVVEDWSETASPLPTHVETAREVLAKLPAAQRELLMMIYWDGLTMAEAAAVLGCRVGAARVRVHRARTDFKSALTAAANEGIAEQPPARKAVARK